jgi:hypothetical protein
MIEKKSVLCSSGEPTSVLLLVKADLLEERIARTGHETYLCRIKRCSYMAK